MNRLPNRSEDRLRDHGAALLILLAVLGLAAVFVLVGRLGGSRLKNQRDPITETALAQAKEALIGHAAAFRDGDPLVRGFGFLPCPDLDNDGYEGRGVGHNCTSAGNGTEGKVVIGRLPYRTLGLPDLRDSNGHCLWYAVARAFNGKAAELGPTDYPSNPPPGSEPLDWDTIGSIAINDEAGETLLASNSVQRGAAAVIFSPGNALAGQSRSGGSPCASGTSNDLEQYLDGNAGGNYAEATPGTLSVVAGSSASGTHNDQLIWVSPEEVFSRVSQRSDFAQQMDTLLDELKFCIESGNLPAPRNATALSGGKLYGMLPDLTVYLIPTGTGPGCSFAVSRNSQNWPLYQNWHRQIRYATCSGTACMTAKQPGATLGQPCEGVLLFAGRARAGQTRPPASDADLFEATPPGMAQPSVLGWLGGASTELTAAGSIATSLTSTISNDVAICLRKSGTGALSFAADLPSFVRTLPSSQLSSPLVTIDTSGKTVTLGKVGAAGAFPAADLFGCTFSDRILSFGTGLRAYFKFTIDDVGEGFTFALADATLNPSASLCGAAGGQMGYSGTAPVGSGLPPIKPPKIGIEFDTLRNVGAPPGGTNDPNSRHAALVFWGALADGSDDNAHGFPAIGVPGTDASNPPAPSGIVQINNLTSSNPANRIFHVRLEIDRSYSSVTVQGTYAVRAWVINDNQITTADELENLKNLAAPLAAAPTLSQNSLIIADSAFGGEAFRTLRAGFTTGQTAADQVVRISGFDLRTF